MTVAEPTEKRSDNIDQNDGRVLKSKSIKAPSEPAPSKCKFNELEWVRKRGFSHENSGETYASVFHFRQLFQERQGMDLLSHRFLRFWTPKRLRPDFDGDQNPTNAIIPINLTRA